MGIEHLLVGTLRHVLWGLHFGKCRGNRVTNVKDTRSLKEIKLALLEPLGPLTSSLRMFWVSCMCDKDCEKPETLPEGQAWPTWPCCSQTRWVGPQVGQLWSWAVPGV